MDIASMLEVQVKEVKEVKEVDSKENVTPTDLNPSVTTVLPPISQDEINFYKLTFSNDISSVRFRRIHCTACDVHIGSAPVQAHNMLEHPILRTLLCAKCREFYGDGTFEQGDDATDMFCRWCANGGNLYCCSYCSNTFCYKCIRRNFDPLVRKKIEADEKWKCFVCNPADLYGIRAVCWALLQHIQTMTRLLQSDRIMSPEEVEERMNLDESECCPRRRKRRRRRTGSNSEEEDETYDPNTNEEPVVGRRKIIKRKYKHRRKSIPNGNVETVVPLKTYSAHSENVSIRSEGSTSLLSIEPKAGSVGSNSGRSVVSSVTIKQQNPPICSRFNPTAAETVKPPAVKTTLYNSTINPVPTVKLLQSTAAFKPLQSMMSPRIHYKNTYQPVYYSTTQMVTIPNQKHVLALNKARVLLPKPRKTLHMMVTPNIIDLDSDSDEPTVVQSSSQNVHNATVDENTNHNVSSPSTVAVPVALVTTDSSCNINRIKITDIEDQSLRELFPSVSKDERSFSEVVLLPRKEEFGQILHNLQVQFNEMCKNSENEVTCRNNIQEARSKIQSLYKEICNTVTQLAHVNDRIVREYNNWEKSHDIKGSIIKDIANSMSKVKENNKVSLDMICVNDSDTDCENEDNPTIVSPSQLITSTNVFEALSKKKTMISHAVGDSSVLCEDKSIQVCGIESRDYEKSINYSILTKTNRPSTEDSILDPIIASKYQEQFIFYLQHIEDHGIEIDSPNNDFLESENLSTSPVDHVEECIKRTLINVPDPELISLVPESETVPNVERIEETSAPKKEYIKVANSVQSKKRDSNLEKEVLIGISSIVCDDRLSNENICDAAAEDDCTIIED